MSDAARIGLAIGFAFLSGIMGLLGSTVYMEIEALVNATRPPEQQVWWGWGLTPRNPHLLTTEYRTLTTEYRRLCPDAPLLRRALTFGGVQVALLAMAALVIFGLWFGILVGTALFGLFGMQVFIAHKR